MYRAYTLPIFAPIKVLSNKNINAMKTLKILASILFLAGLSTGNLIGQEPVKKVFEVYIDIPFACTNQNLAGTLTAEVTILNSHLQERLYGTMIGQTDGLKYYFDGINNIQDKGNWDEWGKEAITYTWPGNYHISRDGKLIGVVYFAYHITVTANGEVSVERGDVYLYSCVGEGRVK
jgi:hypothetical protein